MPDNFEHAKTEKQKTREPILNKNLRPAENWDIDSLLGIELPISVSFGSLEMPLENLMKLGAGSVIELNKSVNDPVTIIVNHRPIAKGEIVVIDGNYGVRILEVESTVDRIRSLG